MQSVAEPLKAAGVPGMDGVCMICGVKWNYNVCVDCEGLRDAMYVFEGVLPILSKISKIKKSVLDEHQKSSLIYILSGKTEEIKEKRKKTLIPLDCYNQDERKRYINNFDSFMASLEEYPDLRNKLFFYDEEKDSYSFVPGYYYDVIKYNYRMIREYIKQRGNV